MRVKLKGVNTVRKRLADGSFRTYHYHRATGEKLEGKPGTAQFLASYTQAQQATIQRAKGTFNDLVRAYTGSVEFAELAASTQAEYKRMLTKAEPRFGFMPVKALDDQRVKEDLLEWRDEIVRASGKREGDNRLTTISAMLSWAVDRGKLKANHILGFKRLYSSDRSDILWLEAHIRAFMTVAPLEMQRALILALHTGQRLSDLLRAAWTNYDGKVLRIRQSKGNVLVAIPCTRALRTMLDGMPRDATVILTSVTKKAWKKRHFSDQWKEASDAAGLLDLHFHDLRGTAITMLAESGCTVPEIASITGHSLKTVTTIMEKYLSRTAALAEAAMEKFENASATDFANRLQTGSISGPKV
ncbi:tyrosine-type recombinase/integrase [Bosea massiliensis]|uniref:Tyrosine-type recombinase/integrase n=1 Tax=Bosea massiliensis TaxID=151419 RepID=A0ABW0P533_9HYPH